MRITEALRWSVYHKTLSTVSLLVGAAIALVGLWLGAGEWLLSVATDPTGSHPGPASLPLAIGGVVLGLAVWQLGRTTVRYHALVNATEDQLDLVDTERLKSEVLESLDGRLSEMEADLEEVRRQAARIEQQQRAGEFEFVRPEEPDEGTASGGGPSAVDQVQRATESKPAGGDANRFGGEDERPEDDRAASGELDGEAEPETAERDVEGAGSEAASGAEGETAHTDRVTEEGTGEGAGTVAEPAADAGDTPPNGADGEAVPADRAETTPDEVDRDADDEIEAPPEAEESAEPVPGEEPASEDER